MQILPSTPLSSIVKHYLIVRNECSRIRKIRSFTDGNSGMVFTLKGRLILDFRADGRPSYLPLLLFTDRSLISEIYIV